MFPASAQALAARFGSTATTDWKAAINAPEVDIVAITTPTPTHLELVEAAAKAKKHIFCEKPFCRTAAQCKKAIAAADKAGVKLFVGHVVRYFQEFETMRTQIASGAIGEPGYVKVTRGGIFPMGAGKWFSDYEQSGGVTFDCMIHDLDWVRYVFGEPERIFCQTLMSELTSGQPLDYSQVTMRMKNGVIAKIIGTWAHPSGFRVTAEACGSGGMLQFDSAVSSMGAMMRETGKGPGMIVPESPVDVSPYELEWAEFLAWIESGATPRVTAHDALRAVEMVEAALESAKIKQPVNL
jgi:predicted dehydrogenase